MEKFIYKLTTLSSLIVSPRASKAFYLELEGFSLQDIRDGNQQRNNGQTLLEKEKLKVIYPFYQYGEYTKYAPKSAVYYLPGSSIKGALLQGESAPGGFMADDIPVPNDGIVLRNIHKAQYLNEQGNGACFGPFFENVGVEMIKDEVELTGEFYIKDRGSAEALIQMANESTKVKLNQMLTYLRELRTRNYVADDLNTGLDKAGHRLSDLLNDKNILLLGGYKGLLHSMQIKDPQQELAGAVFLDPKTTLPHGLAKIEVLSV
ncbi:MAG TPA: hypothetical protein VN381_07915 [Anaerovoracaceae bacterium]|nr:hypothetical protein [Anaerovoracaceae bacterium]